MGLVSENFLRLHALKFHLQDLYTLPKVIKDLKMWTFCTYLTTIGTKDNIMQKK